MSQNAMFYDDPDLLSKAPGARSRRTHRGRRAAPSRSQYLVKTNRSVVVSMPKDVRPGRELIMSDELHPQLARSLAPASRSSSRRHSRRSSLLEPPSNRRRPRRWCSRAKRPSRTRCSRSRCRRRRKRRLPNGLRLMVLEDHRVPQVTFQLMIPVPQAVATIRRSRAGLATWAAAMAREGTATRSSAQISEALETIGAGLFTSAGTSSANGEIDGSCAHRVAAPIDRTSPRISCCIRRSRPRSGTATRARTKPQFTQLRTNPAFLANEMFNKVVFGAHPASRIFPSASAIDAVTAADLAEYLPHALRARSRGARVLG